VGKGYDYIRPTLLTTILHIQPIGSEEYEILGITNEKKY
jgi:hypothetical protein